MFEDLAEQHKHLGRAVTDIIAEHAASLDSRRVTSEATPADLQKLFDEPLPEKGISVDQILARFKSDVAPHAMHVPSPRYYGQFNPTPLPIGVWADALCSALNQSHYSVERSADILGLGRESLRKIPTDNRFHIRTDSLREEIERDKKAGRSPCCVVGVAGTTSTGVVDPLEELAAIARKNNCWFHVDAAYGGALAFSQKHKARLRGIEQADSVTFDPHKWMFVPFACGAVLVRGGGNVLREAFDITPEYLSEDRGGADVEYDFFRYGQMGTRRFNSLKLWMALKFMGVQGYAEIIDQQVEHTKNLASRLDELEDFQRLGEVETAVCCFRFLPQTANDLSGSNQEHLQQRLQQQIERGGEAWLTTTVLHGRRALRVNINSFLTERRHIDDLVELLQRESGLCLRGLEMTWGQES